MFVTEDDYQ